MFKSLQVESVIEEAQETFLCFKKKKFKGNENKN